MIQVTINITDAQAAALEAERAEFNKELSILKDEEGKALPEITSNQFIQSFWDQAANEKVAEHRRKERLAIANAFSTVDAKTQTDVKVLLKITT